MVPLIGRESALGSAAAFLDEVHERASALVVAGEVGLGKTALWLDTVAAARAKGHRVLEARPSENEARLVYSALSDLVGAAFDDVRADLPPPQERALATALLLSEAEEPAEFRTIATAFLSVLDALAAEQPVVVAVDDAQWLDPASAAVIAFAARRLPQRVGLLLTLRSEHGAEAVELVRDLPADLVSRIALEPLSLAALHHVIHGRTGISLARPLLTRLAAASGGNPLFALEIARLLARQRDPGALAGPLPMPSTLQELVTARLATLSETARATLLLVAAMSRPTAPNVEAAFEGDSGAAPALAEAEEAGVIVREGERIRFAHPLLASCVYDEATPPRRRRAHRRLAEVIPDLEERARHRGMSTTGPDEPAAAELEAAAHQAAVRGAQEAAAELYDGSCVLTPPDLPEALTRRRLGRATALSATGDFQLAHAVARQALADATSPTLRGEALALLASFAWHDGDGRAATAHAEEALVAVMGERSLEGAARARLVRFNFSVDLERALQHADAALAVLDEEREPGLLAHVLIDRFFGSALSGRHVSHALLERALVLEAQALAGSATLPQPMPLLWFHCSDDLAGARERYAMEVQWYRERGNDVSVADRMSHLALAELRAGECEAAERLVEQSCAALDGLDVRGPRAMAFEKRSLVDAHRGRTDRARATLEPLVEAYEGSGQAWWAALALSTLAFTQFVEGDHAAADASLRRMRQHAAAVGARDILFDRSEPFHVEALLALGDVDGARDVLARLEDRGTTLPRLWIASSLPRTRALVLAADGDVTGALSLLGTAGPEEEPRLPFELGWTLLVKGRLHRRAKQKRAAADALTSARELFERLEAPAFVARARAELDRIGLRRAPGGLTPTERRIAELAAEGRTNREIAQAAFVSQKTVEANLARVYRKLGIRSRAELGAHMAVQRDGLLET